METLHQPEDIIAQRYRIVTPLGQGGIGTTYEAEDLTNYQRVAIKVLSLRNITEWKVLELFEREAKVLASLHHPAIPQYLNYFHEDTPNDRRFYLVQELVGGSSLADLVQKNWHAEESKVKHIASQVLSILDYLHSLKPPVIHRDIKPQNIIMRQDGQIFLVDFGAVQDVYRHTVSRGSTFVGTLGYMPLEQFRGQVGAASDLYSLGATLLFLLTHKSPDDLPQNRMKIDFRSQVQISNEFADWLEKILEPAIEDRFPSATVALEALRSIQEPTQLVMPKRKQPKGSAIFYQRTNKSLLIKIPGNIYWQVLLGLIPIFLILFYYNSMNIISIILWLTTSSPIFTIGFLIFFWMRSNPDYYLEIDDKFFHCRWNFLCFWGNNKIKITDIKKIEVETKLNSQGQKITKCLVSDGINFCYFGSKITIVEQNWLVAEIQDFLRQINS